MLLCLSIEIKHVIMSIYGNETRYYVYLWNWNTLL